MLDFIIVTLLCLLYVIMMIFSVSIWIEERSEIEKHIRQLEENLREWKGKLDHSRDQRPYKPPPIYYPGCIVCMDEPPGSRGCAYCRTGYAGRIALKNLFR